MKQKRLYGEQKAARDRRIREYATTHPNVTVRGIARIFRLSHPTILKALKEQGEGRA